MPFQTVLRRFRRKHNVAEAADAISMIPNLFDILYSNQKMLIDLPFQKRREILTQVASQYVTPQLVSDNEAEIEAYYHSALDAGHEGVMLKVQGSRYTPGVRGKDWVKIKPEADTLDLADTDNDDTAVMIYTAGTTGNPKGVMLTHYNWYSHVTGYYEQVMLDSWGVSVKGVVQEKDLRQGKTPLEEVEVFGVRRNRVSLITLPLFHGYGVFALNLEYLTGGKLVVMSRWNAEEAMDCIERFRITDFRGVPTMYIQLLNHPAAPKYDLSSLQTCICGSAPMPLEVARQWREKYGIDIWEGYGLSEATTVNCGNIAGRQPPKYGSIGKCYQKGNTIKIFDENDREVPTGETGEIVIKGPGVMKGYWNKPVETAEAIRDGWLHTGDVGYMDEEGYLFITDRKKDLIIRGGRTSTPRKSRTSSISIPRSWRRG